MIYRRDVAQLGSAPRLGRGGRTFKSCHPDHYKNSTVVEFFLLEHTTKQKFCCIINTKIVIDIATDVSNVYPSGCSTLPNKKLTKCQVFVRGGSAHNKTKVLLVVKYKYRDVAQLGSALSWGGRGRWFESSHPDLFQYFTFLDLA